MSEAEWKVTKAGLESSPDYIIVRKSRQQGSLGGQLSSGKDGVATSWFEINKNDLGAAGGGGYDDTKVWVELDSLQKQIDDLDIPDTTDLATKAELAALKSTVDTHLANHPDGGGDVAQLEADVAQLLLDVKALQDGLAEEIKNRTDGDKTLQDQIDAIGGSGYDDTELRGLIQGNTDALDGKSDDGHTHADAGGDPYDDTEIRKDFADADQQLQDQIDNINASGYDDTELRGLISDEEDARVEGDKALQDQIDAIQTSGYDDTQIREDFAAADELLQDQIDALEGFDPTPLEEKDEEQDARLDQIDLDQEAQDDRLVAVEKDIADHLASHPSGDGGNGSLTYKSIDNQAHINTKGVIFLAINGASKQYIKVNKEDVNGNATGTPVQGETLKIEAEGKENEFTIDYISEYDGYWMIIGDEDSKADAIIITDKDKEVVLTFEQDEAAAGGFDPTYLEEKDAEQDARLDAVEKDIEEHSEEFEELKSQVDEHLANHSGDGGENVSQWTTKKDPKKADSGFVEFVIAGGSRQSVLIPTLDGDGNPSPVFELGDIMTIKSDGNSHTFEVAMATPAPGGCANYLSDYNDEGYFASTPGNEATIIKGGEAGEDHDHTEFEEINERLDAVEKATGIEKTSAKQTYITTTGPVNNSDGLVNLMVSKGNAADQWVNFSNKDANDVRLVTPEVGDTFTVEYQDQVVYGEVNFCQGSDMWLTLPDGVDIIVSNSNGVEAKLYIGSPREDEVVPEHDHSDFEEINERLDALEAAGPSDPTERQTCTMGRFINTGVYINNGEAQAIGQNLKLHKPTDRYGDAGNQGDLDDVDVWEVMGDIQPNDTVWLFVGDDVHEITLAMPGTNRSEVYDFKFKENVESLIPKDAEFSIQSDAVCDELVPEHEHETPEDVVTVVDGQNGLSIWRGTEAEYNAIADKQDNVLYITTA